MVLDSNQVVPQLLQDMGNLDRPRGVVCPGIEEEAKLQLVTIVSHDLSPIATRKGRVGQIAERSEAMSKYRADGGGRREAGDGRRETGGGIALWKAVKIAKVATATRPR